MEQISHIERADLKGLEIPQDVRIYFACVFKLFHRLIK